METAETVKHLSAFLNTFSGMDRERFLQEMRALHPTLQQIFAGYVMMWLNDYATYNPDGRNQISVEYCRKILESFQAATGEEKLREHFPMR